MKEEYLHALWKERRLHPLDLSLTNGDHLDILHFGFHNENFEGPDFSFAGVSIDGVDHFGPVEMHVKSSDWYRHGHQNDPLYNDVILHVVLEHDKDVVVNGRKLPTLELKTLIDPLQYFQYKSGHRFSKRIVCKNMLGQIEKSTLQNWMIEQYRKRLNELRKRIEWSSDNNRNLYLLALRSFGMGINGDALFDALGRLSLNEFCSINHDQMKVLLEGSKVHRTGTRPANNPIIRVHQLRVLLDELLIIDLCEFWESRKEIYRRVNSRLDGHGIPKIGSRMWDNFLINAYIPYLYFFEGYSESIARLYLRELKPESNRITRFWSPILSPKNAMESQAIIAAYKYSCSAKKCLSCAVGKVIL